jgi:hypothetical protein
MMFNNIQQALFSFQMRSLAGKKRSHIEKSGQALDRPQEPLLH